MAFGEDKTNDDEQFCQKPREVLREIGNSSSVAAPLLPAKEDLMRAAEADAVLRKNAPLLEVQMGGPGCRNDAHVATKPLIECPEGDGKPVKGELAPVRINDSAKGGAKLIQAVDPVKDAEERRKFAEECEKRRLDMERRMGGGFQVVGIVVTK